MYGAESFGDIGGAAGGMGGAAGGGGKGGMMGGMGGMGGGGGGGASSTGGRYDVNKVAGVDPTFGQSKVTAQKHADEMELLKALIGKPLHGHAPGGGQTPAAPQITAMLPFMLSRLLSFRG